MAIDGHFIVEQTVRARNDFLLNFNGTAGLWRKSCIEDAGGWQWDTLTEDLDLSYRAQMRGWKIDYLPDVVVPAELPAHVEAYKNQQFRWAKGSFQVVRKILPKLFEKSKLPWHVRLLALLHITGYGVHPLMLAILILTLPVGLFAPQAFKFFPLSVIAGLGPPLVYLSAKAAHSPSPGRASPSAASSYHYWIWVVPEYLRGSHRRPVWERRCVHPYAQVKPSGQGETKQTRG